MLVFHCFRSERIRCTDYKRWCVEKRNGGDIWMAEKFKVALGKETESLADFHRADRGFQGGPCAGSAVLHLPFK